MIAALFLLSVGAVGAREPYPILKDLVEFGQRHAGAPRRAEAVGRLARSLKESGLKVSREAFQSADPKDGRLWDMVNLIGRFRPRARCRFILGTHYDVRHVAEEDPDPALRDKPIPGANDGSSGVAVLLALAPKLKDILPPSVGADLAFFDGEEMGYPGAGGYCAGSIEHGRRLSSSQVKPKFGIILDMVCAPEAVYKIEPISYQAHPALVDAFWEAGLRRLPAAFSRGRWIPINDDHVPLSRAGVPSILVIGLDYKPWHTSGDVVERCSPERLSAIQGVVEDFLRTKLPEFLDCR